MRTRIGFFFLGLVGLATLAIGLPSCDNLDAGRPADDGSAPIVRRILVQEANTYQVIDLLNNTEPLTCSDTNPCPVGTAGLGPTVCTIPEGKTEGTCDNPTSAKNLFTVGDPAGGTIQVRIVLSKILSPDVEDVMKDDKGNKVFTLKDPSAFGLFGPDGMEIGADGKYYDNTGSNFDTPDPIGEPLGPALVINVPDHLLVGATYTVKINGANLKDRSGKAITNDVNGPLVSSGYTFKTEPLAVIGAVPDITDGAPDVKPNDVVQLSFNNPVDEASITVEVKDAANAPVAAAAWLDRSPDKCEADPFTVDLYPAGGSSKRWPAGKLTVTVTAKDATGKSTSDAFEGSFTVKAPDGDPAMDDAAIDNHPPPAECGMPAPTDGGSTD